MNVTGNWTTAEHTNVEEGRCDSAKIALKGVVYFACWCLDEGSNPKIDLPDWGDSQTSYRKAIDYAFEHAGVADASPIKADTAKRSQWAKIAAYIHGEGDYRVDEERFLDFLGTTKGGIRGLYNHAVTVLGKSSAGRNGKKGKLRTGCVSSAGADAKISADLAKLHKQMKEQPNYVLILLDANQGKDGKRKKNPKTPNAITSYISKMDEYVTAWNPSNDDVNGDGGIMAMFREDEPLGSSDADEAEAVQVSGGGDE